MKSKPDWILCRGFSEIPIQNDATLQRLAISGAVRSDDYLVNPHLDTCMEAKNVPILKGFFRQALIRRLKKIFLTVALAGAVSLASMACDYAVPITANATRPVEPGLLGDWVAAEPKKVEDGDLLLSVVNTSVIAQETRTSAEIVALLRANAGRHDLFDRSGRFVRRKQS